MDDPTTDRLELEPEIAWDGAILSVWARNARKRIRCEIPRTTIHAVPQFSDALDREILRDRAEIVDRLRSKLLRKGLATDTVVVRLTPDDLKQ